ncbi:MAG TPA: hypothetical protein VNN80_00845, partial [Polyangiaceae bacterium]|nr:hypothetical protein [Polyangiaceae bacterium]
MSHLRLGRVWSGRLADVNLELDPGVHVIIGAEEDGSGELIELCAGVRTARRGAVEVDGLSPNASPACRRTIASLLPSEDWGESPGSLHGWLAELGARLGFAPEALLERARLEAGRRLASLSGGERRKLACFIALARQSP